MNNSHAIFSPRHIAPLLIATGMGLGGTMPFISASKAITTFGLPPQVAESRPAQAIMTINGGRNIAMGLAIWLLYAQGNLDAIDTVMACTGITGLVDGWVCWNEGVMKKAWFRAAFGVLVGGWGLLGMTSGESVPKVRRLAW